LLMARSCAGRSDVCGCWHGHGHHRNRSPGGQGAGRRSRWRRHDAVSERPEGGRCAPSALLGVAAVQRAT
ncbi:MAG: hypothetical protein ACK56I_32125, partial [bacterium]